MREHLVAVDIGTGSARAGIFDPKGALLAKASRPILMHRPTAVQAEHDSEDIWQAVTDCVREALRQAGVTAGTVAAIGFDATCSLVVRGRDGGQLGVSASGASHLDTIVWLDHRAARQADRLNAGGHPILGRSGGRISPEMAIPKLMWLKQAMPDVWAQAHGIYDLSDYMTFRATGSEARSCSTLAAKWSYLAHEEQGWCASFLEEAGLGDLFEKSLAPRQAVPLGRSLGPLTSRAAAELGLDVHCQVAPGMIDAYAGALGLLGRHAGEPETMARQAALIAGTSSCVIRLLPDASPLPGYWGPYWGVSVPGYWLMEGGQSATGALLDHIVAMHAAGGPPEPALHARIIARIAELRAREGDRFGHPIDVLPDFHGNRSPSADAAARGVLSGLSLDPSFDGLCRLYWRTAVGLACGIRHIIEQFQAAGPAQGGLHMGGGHALNPLLVSLYADVTGQPIAVPRMKESVLLGTAMNAAAAAGIHGDLVQAGAAMACAVDVQEPEPARRASHERDYQRFLAMLRHRAELQALYEDPIDPADSPGEWC